MKDRLFALAVAVFVLLALWGLLGRTVFGHGSSEWIMENTVTRWCCGPADCAVAEPGELVRLYGAWLNVPTGLFLRDHEGGHYVSIDSQVWRCVGPGVFRCLFLPVQA